jgi:hypothetical protein
MREGFHWDNSNILRNEQVYESYINPPMTCPRHPKRPPIGWNPAWKHVRRFVLRDMHHQPPHWAAELAVYAASENIVRGVKLELLTRENVASMRAHGPERRRAYEYRAWRRNESYNILYNDMVMEGWWPWPGNNGLTMPQPVRHSPVGERHEKKSCPVRFANALGRMKAEVKEGLREWVNS